MLRTDPNPHRESVANMGFLPMFPELTGYLNGEILELFMGSMGMLIPSRDRGRWWELGSVALIESMA